MLNGRKVTAYLDANRLSQRERTRTTRLAASKRRLYRRYLGWTNDPQLCGQILERQVHATLDAMRHDVLPEASKPGQVSSIGGQPVRGGPLDHAGYLIANPGESPPELVGFLVEDKNVRSVLYPRVNEVWDLLVKAGDFPAHVPLLIAPHAHYTLLTFFKAIGAVVYTSGRQWFAPEPAISSTQFKRVVTSLGFRDAYQLGNPDDPSRAIRKFFASTLRGEPKGESQSLIIRSRERWAVAAPVCASYSDLRDEALDHDKRLALFQQMLENLDEEGLDVADLRSQHLIAGADADPDNADDWDLDLDLAGDE